MVPGPGAPRAATVTRHDEALTGAFAFHTWKTTLSPVPTTQCDAPYSPPNDLKVMDVFVHAGTLQVTTSGDVPSWESVVAAQAPHQVGWARAASSSSPRVPWARGR